MKIERIIFVLALFFLVGAVVGTPYVFLTKWEAESAYAQTRPGNSSLGDGDPWNIPDPVREHWMSGGNDPWNSPDPVHEHWMPGISHPRNNSPQAVPEPSMLMILGTGLAVLGGYSVLRFRNKGK
jgi:hypothetical protein